MRSEIHTRFSNLNFSLCLVPRTLSLEPFALDGSKPGPPVLSFGKPLSFGPNQLNFKEFRPQFSGYEQAIIFDVVGNAIEDVDPAIAIFRS